MSRLEGRLDEIYAIGGGPGANRIGYSPEEDEAHRLVAGWLQEAGFEVEVDPYGNLVGRIRGSEPGLPEVWAGSHLDSVPHGGRHDGPLGVLAALEAVSHAAPARRTLGVVAFRDEERGCVGSKGCVAGGRLPGFFLEVHHEQGPLLELAGAPVGVVTGIVGYVRAEREVLGSPGHAGTTPMDVRDDALVEVAREILRIQEVARSIEGAVATVGRVSVEPGGANVIPSRVVFSVDARAPDDERLTRLVDEIGLDDVDRVSPVELRGASRDALATAVTARGLPLVELHSGAGHDAGVLASAGVDAAMLFVRAQAGGVSHSPEESCSPEDVELAVAVLADALASLGSTRVRK